MPNLYATPTEIKAAMPDGIRAETTKYDSLLLRLAGAISRFVDRRCRRLFYPSYGVRYFSPGRFVPEELWVDDLLAITSVEFSTDNGESYEALTASDYYGTVGGDWNDPRSWNLLALAANGSRSTWPAGQRTVKVTGWWGYADDRAQAWEASGLTLAGAYLAGGASLAVADVTALDRWGMDTALCAGRLARVDDELFEVVSTTNNLNGNDAAAVLGARNGSAAAGHAEGAAISIWRAPEPVRQATIIQAVRQLERGFQGFGDARATPEIGQIMFIRALDPEAEAMLKAGYIREGVG